MSEDLRARYRAKGAWIGRGASARLCAEVEIELGPEGRIVAIREGAESSISAEQDLPIYELGPRILIPGFVNAHSHAFQREIRGRTHRGQPDSFWSWREAMYEQVLRLDPESFEAATLACYREMAASGISTVGEFHYLHHQAGGERYEDPNELSHRVVRAAKEAGLKLVLLDVFYERGGAGKAPDGGQLRFCDRDVEAYLDRVEDLLNKYQDNPDVHIGVAPHSVRAVSADSLRKIGAFAKKRDLPVHIHLSEQVRENEECQAEHGCSPAALLESTGLLERDGSLTAVHAIHIDDDDRARLSGQQVCACPTTEADLGDGIIGARQILAAGVEICLGSDSNSVIDLVQEARALEMHERLARQARLALALNGRELASILLHASTAAGARALGVHSEGALELGASFDALAVDLDHPQLRPAGAEFALDALFCAGTSAAIGEMWSQGRRRIGRER